MAHPYLTLPHSAAIMRFTEWFCDHTVGRRNVLFCQKVSFTQHVKFNSAARNVIFPFRNFYGALQPRLPQFWPSKFCTLSDQSHYIPAWRVAPCSAPVLFLPSWNPISHRKRCFCLGTTLLSINTCKNVILWLWTHLRPKEAKEEVEKQKQKDFIIQSSLKTWVWIVLCFPLL